MKIKVTKTSGHEIRFLRNLFLREINCQFIHNSYHERGWTDVYSLLLDDVEVGYATLCGSEDRTIKDTLIEYYVIPLYRRFASRLFQELNIVAHPLYMDCQTNDTITSAIFFEFAHNIQTSIVLFEDDMNTDFAITGASFRLKKTDDYIFEHHVEGVGEYVVELNGEIVATGGFLQHYNLPFADLYMEVKENCRKRGIDAFIIQELKRVCYLSARVPAARCNIQNKASKATLVKAGMRVVGFGLKGDLTRILQ